jgi:hypothetical protein
VEPEVRRQEALDAATSSTFNDTADDLILT